MSLASIFRKTLLVSCLGMASPALAEMGSGNDGSFKIDDFLNDAFDNAQNICVQQGQSEQKTNVTDHVFSLLDLARKDTELGDSLISSQEKNGYAMCMVEDKINIGTNRIVMLQDAEGQYRQFYGTISSDIDAYPKDLTTEEMTALQAFGILEEYAHGLNAIGLLMNSGIDTNNLSPMLSAEEAIQKMWADEALASSFAVLIAREQHENGNDLLWNTIQKFDVYKNIIKKIDDSVQDNPDNLKNGVAHLEGFKAWYETGYLLRRAADKVIAGYQQQFNGFKEFDFPVDLMNFSARNVYEMAATLNPDTEEFFHKNQNVLWSAMSPDWFQALAPTTLETLNQTQSNAAMHNAVWEDRNGRTVTSLTQ